MPKRKPAHVVVTLEEVGGSPDRMFKKFGKKVKKSGIIDKVRRRQYYEKPSLKRKRKRLKKKILAEQQTKKYKESQRD
jgi:ribosomal protein S21